jgi:hypothetical protein
MELNYQGLWLLKLAKYSVDFFHCYVFKVFNN